MPNIFYKTNPYTIQNIKLWLNLNNKNFILLSDKYENIYQKLEWQCLKEGCGEEFKMDFTSILHNGCNCPCCEGRQVGLSNCLATKNPELAKEWHPIKNGELTPYDVPQCCGENVWWQCKKGHEWESVIANRKNNKGCPYCSGFYPSKENNLLVNNPKLCEEWNYNKNNKNPEEYTSNSISKVYWICKKCGYEWKIEIHNRNQGNGCPCCNNSKANDKIIDFCKYYNLNYLPEYRIKECRDSLPLPFDVKTIINNNLYLIEADGKHHFEPVRFGGISEERALENFKTTQRHDVIKNKYCEDNKISLLRIPYWEFKNIEEILKKELL
jgi:hypothetical protein